MTTYALRGARDEIVVIIEARVVRDERPEIALVGQQGICIGCHVRVELRLCWPCPCWEGTSWRDRQGATSERVIARENNKLIISGNRDTIFMVMPAHPVNRVMFSVPHVESDH